MNLFRKHLKRKQEVDKKNMKTKQVKVNKPIDIDKNRIQNMIGVKSTKEEVVR